MQNNSDTIICPQITTSFIACLKLVFVIINANYISWGALASPLFSILIAVFVILGIKNRNFSYYNSAKIICIILSILETIAIAFVAWVLLFLFSHSNDSRKKDNTNNVVNIIIFYFIVILLFIWIEFGVLIFYTQRVQNYCLNITTKTINNSVINEPLT